MNNIIVGIDLAKKVNQVCVIKRNKVFSNQEMIPSELVNFLANARPMTVVFEACSMSNYWKQVASQFGHDARLVSAKLVSQIRQNQKTDKNDALAVAQACQLAEVNFIQGKTFKQQELQCLVRMRELAVKQKVSHRNQIESLLLEFNIRIAGVKGGLNSVVQHTLENAENGFSDQFRHALNIAWQLFISVSKAIADYDRLLLEAVNELPECKKLLSLEGVGVINAVNLFIALSCGEIGVFNSGRDAAACIGVTPIQHSSGGKLTIGSVGRRTKNGAIRSYLVSGAMAVVQQVARREPKTAKEHWLKQLIDRRGKRCAAVALANKTVRTAFALLNNGTEYRVQPI